MIVINRDDEVTLTARERGHTYGPGDVLLGDFQVGDLRIKHVVRFDATPGGGCGYVDEVGEPLPSGVELIEWRYANASEVARFEGGQAVDHLLPCPFCGSCETENLHSAERSPSPVYCIRCGARGPCKQFLETSEDYITGAAAWNVRSEDR